MTRLGEYEECSICHEYGWTNTHKCPPAWEVWADDDDYFEDEPIRVYASTPRGAAEKWAAKWDEGETAESGGSVKCKVKPLLGGKTQDFTVECAMEPIYYAYDDK